MGSTIYTEVFVLALVLISNVLGNNFIGYIPRTATEIAARPQLLSPKLLLQVRKFRQQRMGCFALQPCRRRLPYRGAGSFDLDAVFGLEEARSISNDRVVSYNSRLLQI